MTSVLHHRPHAPATDGVAARLEEALRPFIGGDLPVRLVAWDGSVAGPEDSPVVELRSPEALRRLLWHPGELGAAQAYVTGELDVPGDLDAALTHAFAVAKERGLSGRRPPVRALAGAVRTAFGLDLIGRPPAPPATQARIRGRLHSKDRDRSAISHHYDTTADFYSLILDEETMAYSCGYHASADQPLAEAQHAKLDLVCRKLGLEPGMRLLDVGCGWGSLSLHAAEQFGARVVGVTISAEQKRFAEAAARRRGLTDLVEFRLCDYRDAVPHRGAEPPSAGDRRRERREAGAMARRRSEGGLVAPSTDGNAVSAPASRRAADGRRGTEALYDAVASLEMGEHVGQANYATYAQVLHDAVRPGGRVLVQQMSRTGRWPGGGPFIESFIAPDMHMRPVGETVALLEASGLEARDVHALREHYVLTVAGWLERFEANVDAITDLVGEELVRVWRLYLVGGSMAFRDGRMGVDQVLLVRPGGPHGLPWTRSW
ncbi:cyclopropane-fatty-acyl-phospholipid synthase [Nocardioides aromaticivorans]|uniref:Cyclopropane-fatty-acyl-phospholipid synthase n=1 Tax=Nocardioides aromaticivorans TaxID=200618 RepID=A0A7Z0CNT1_9ACTN|nr:cyclopropane-fatty-acyl-phospholipid synthase family protein [Nocardioides aromaticivorans]NYI45152.1 cyclopropane-fatty-acyl-phospholipid synthase [Nocardioides aromaticivorans]